MRRPDKHATSATAWHRLGALQLRHDRLTNAAKSFRHALALEPTLATAWQLLGVVSHQMMMYDDAAACYRRALQFCHDDSRSTIIRLIAELKEDVLVLNAHARGQQGMLQEAIELFREATTSVSAACSTWLNLGIYLHAAGRTEEGIDALKKAVKINPDYAEAWQNMGLLHQALGETIDAYTCFRCALVIRPDYPTARWNLALLQLLLGDYEEGFRNFEQRFLRIGAAPQRHTDLSRWRGEDIRGKTLLVHAEQGYGDTIQFSRFLPLLAHRGIKVAVEVQDHSLLDLIKGMPEVQAVCTRTEPRPPVDLQIPMLSLAFICGTTLENIPSRPYYVPETLPLEKWRQVIGNSREFKVGIVWRGRTTPDPGRSIPVEHLSPLLSVSGVQWFSLHVDEEAHIETPPSICHSHCAKLTDFLETAAFICSLDLIITIDSAVAHLAGTLGKPTWVLLPFAPDWRWMLERDDSPWYPSMRLFRQEHAGDRKSVIVKVTALLEERITNQLRAQADPVHTELSLEFYLAAANVFKSRDYAGAASLLKKALTHNSGLFEAQFLLGMVYGCMDDFESAARHLREAVRIKPDSSGAHLLLGKALDKLGAHEGAIVHLRKALEFDTTSVETVCALAGALSSAGYSAESERNLEEFSDIGYKEPLWHFTIAMRSQATDFQTALFHYSEALRLNPEYHEAGLNYAVLLLSLGRYDQGWEVYEHRIPWLNLNPELGQIPRWHDEPLAGKAILVATEQGFGDSIQFIRYAQLLKSRGATVHVLCTNNLPVRPLMECAAGVDSTIIPGEPVPPIDWYVPIMSLPWLFGTTLETVPSEPGYISPDTDAVKAWQKRLEQYKEFRVGLVWSGNRALNANSSRSIPFNEFRSLLEVEEATFFTLQIGADALNAEDVASYQNSLVDMTSHIRDFSDTAAFIANLDLVISVDTATAHLAGALGKPVWTLLYYPAEWRWMREGEKTPWYPSMRLFRQDTTMKWDPVLAKVKHELEKALQEFYRVLYSEQMD